MRILISVVNFRHLTGAELYVYELSRSLAARGHDVSIVSQAGGVISERARHNGVEVYDFASMPDGLSFDVLHVQEYEPARWAMTRFPDTPVVATVHSQWPCENPLVDDRIHKYVCIRPEIRDKIVTENGIPIHRTTVVYNGVDFSRFNREPVPSERDRDLVLFAGTVDSIRRQAGLHLIQRSLEEDFDVLFIGTRHDTHLDGQLPPNVQWLQGDVWEIDRFVKACTATAGIVLGRTTLEGWACGKPGWIYDVDLDGRIKDVTLYPPPHKDLLAQFDAEFMADQIELLYAEAIGHLGAVTDLRRHPQDLEVGPDRLAVLGFADELCDHPELLRSWASAAADNPLATLVLYGDSGTGGEGWISRITAALASAGLSDDDLDMLLVVATEANDHMRAITARVTGVFTERSPLEQLASIPHAGVRAAAKLLDGRGQRQAA